MEQKGREEGRAGPWVPAGALAPTTMKQLQQQLQWQEDQQWRTQTVGILHAGSFNGDCKLV